MRQDPSTARKSFLTATATLLMLSNLILLYPGASFSQQSPSEILLVNGNILTLDADDSVVSSVRIVGGRFIAVGDNLGEVDPSAMVIDLDGRTVIPGLIDSHVHYFRDSHVPGHLFSSLVSRQPSRFPICWRRWPSARRRCLPASSSQPSAGFALRSFRRTGCPRWPNWTARRRTIRSTCT